MSSGGRFDQKKRNNAPVQQQQESVQEVEEVSLESQEPEFARQQNHVGNQAVSSMIAAKGAQSGTSDGAAGIDISMSVRTETEEKEGAQFGGDDAPTDPGPLSISPSAYSSSKGIKKFKDRQALRQYMPDDQLPDPDPDYLVAILRSPSGHKVSDTSCLDHFLQPSTAVVKSSLRSWSQGIEYWAGHSLAERCITHMLLRPPPCLQDAEGRVLFARSRTASAALALLCESPTISQPADPLTCSFLCYCLEIWGRLRNVESFRIEVQSNEANRLPVAAKLLEPTLPGNSYHRPPQALNENASASLEFFIRKVIDAWDPLSFVPNFSGVTPPEEDVDDPLNLDAFMVEILGQSKPQADFLKETAIAAAENLATECARLRIQVAGTASIISDLSELWSTGSPDRLLMECAQEVDVKVREALKLLVEVATAAKQQQVAAQGLVTGLHHAAKRVTLITDTAVNGLLKAISSVAPGNPCLITQQPPSPDILTDAWADGDPAVALTWLDTLPESLERDLAHLLTRADLGLSASALLDEAVSVRDRALATDNYLYAHVAGLIAANGYLQTDQNQLVFKLASDMRKTAWNRRNGLGLAAAALFQLEALTAQGETEKANVLHIEAGKEAWTLGAHAAASLLGRWQPYREQDQPNPED